MNKVAASGLATCLALAMLAGSPMLRLPTQAQAAPTTFVAPPLAVSRVAGVPAAELPPEGRCRIWYDQLPAHAQPAQMECEHAHWVARTWGGRVVSHEAELAAYEGRNDFTGVPGTDVPRAGYCRVWADGAVNPRDLDCRTARRMASTSGGRVLHMPL